MPEVGDTVTVILWRGEWLDNGREILARARRDAGLSNVRVAGSSSRWFVVADAVRYEP